MGLDWLKVIGDEAGIRLKKNGKALLLAQIPGLLRKNGINVDDLLAGRKLKELIESEGPSVLRLVQDVDPKIWGVVPKEETITADPQALFRAAPPSAPLRKIPRYKRSVWSAFSRKLDINYRRFIEPERGFSYSDVATNEMPPARGIEITSDYIVSGGVGKEEVVAQKLEEWAQAHQISPNELEERQPDRGKKTWPMEFGELTDVDLARIMVPLDIVVRLLKK